MGGEYFYVTNDDNRDAGPSPRGWGIRRSRALSNLVYRSIPTWVGNTFNFRFLAGFSTVHPHVGGEYLSKRDMEATKHGPSPRGWGIHANWSRSGSLARSIPTWVGNTCFRTCQLPYSAVHPHVGGEYYISNDSRRYQCGPSPRGWGILSYLEQLTEVERFEDFKTQGSTIWHSRVFSARCRQSRRQ